jgi:signal transduction histidine kinase/CheY-like chemotaxis protein
MLSYFSRLLDNATLSPHGICLLWRPELLWTHALSDALIGLAYMTIPAALAVIILRRRDIPFGWLAWSFALFITACGATHFMSIVTLWKPYYGFEALVKAVTAVASIGTSIALWRLIPLAVSLPSPERLRTVNAELRQRLAERDEAIALLEREREERKRAEEALLQALKMDALGQLTGGIAHDFNNLLQAVQGSFEMISRRAADPVKVRQLAEGGLNASERGAALTSKLLTFARTKQLKTETFFAADMVAEMRELLARSIGNSVDLRFDLDNAEVPVASDRTQTELALLNLVLNARDASPPGAQIIVRTEPYSAGAADVDLAPGAYVRLSVIDKGPGMTPEVAKKAFDPFFTTKPIGQGTGLGLSQVYGLARQSGGAARIDSVSGRGAQVSIFIPRAQDAVEVRAPEAPREREVPLPHALVLLVDDDELVGMTGAEMLEGMGLEVRRETSGAAALETAEKPDLALLDYAMPGMTGAELARRLRARWPDLRVVFVTGYADAEELEAVLGPKEAILRKPYKQDELRGILGRVLVGA